MKKHAIFAILAVAAVLRLWSLGGGDITGNDEVLYAFRAIGMLDYDDAPNQTTPIEWFDPNTPGWTKLSFHDHPPLVFLVQNVFMKVFGENVFAFRLPSAIFGILSVYFIYLIGRRLFSETAGLISAGLLAVTVNHVYISRIGIQESYVIFFLLLGSYLFIRTLEDKKYLLWTGAAIGLGLLTKYTAFILAPIFLTYLAIYKREYFREKYLWLGALLALAIFSPVIIYNIQLYRAVGHFDFQISYILGQNPEVWKAAPGKEEIGTLGDRLRNFIPNLIATNSKVFLVLSVFGFFLPFKRRGLLPIIVEYLILLLLFVGPTTRFLTMLTPFLALGSGNILFLTGQKFWPEKKRFALSALSLIFLFEIFYSVNSQIIPYPKGPDCCSFSKVRYDNYSWGYNELEKFLEKELSGKYPAIILNSPHRFITDLQNASVEKVKGSGSTPSAAIIVYNDNIHKAPQLWSLDRRQIYHGWPVLKTEDYLALPAAGFKNHYFIMPTDKLPWRTDGKFTDTGIRFEQTLSARGLVPTALYNNRGEEVFRIYKF